MSQPFIRTWPTCRRWRRRGGTRARTSSSGTPVAGTIIERRDELDPAMEWIAGPAESGARIVRIEAPPGAGCARSSTRSRGRAAGRIAAVEPVLQPGFLLDNRRRRNRALRHAPRPPCDCSRHARRARTLGRPLRCRTIPVAARHVGGRPHAVVCRVWRPAARQPLRSGRCGLHSFAGACCARRRRGQGRAGRGQGGAAIGGWPGALPCS